ncbi:accessory Sec system translocase SecA2 [Virgibacillus halodenitrificans]|uniref:accessory Sec system translocase SecA2 n=1 Tax=Virgibacillus halodenitrificans TaxID=1482 RepID=UPI000EF55869|nr:accessory Sec system translocase SecA2 [Virgibacillus halodenitrificans]
MGLTAYFDKRYRKSLEKIANKVMELEGEFKQLSDEELQGKTQFFKTELDNGKTIDDIKIEASATVREAAYRVLGMRHYFVQIVGGLALLEGDIAEMATGEGKTLVSSLPSYIRALEGKGVHVITSNEYLAERDKEQIGKVHEFLGLKVGLNMSGMDNITKQEAYAADITYGVGNEFGFDYLRDHLVYDPMLRVQRPLYFAIIDEVDSILVDEARTPLIIAGKAEVPKNLYATCDNIIKTLKKEEHYKIDVESKTVTFTERGVEKIQKILGIDNLYDLKHQQMNHYLTQSLKANVILDKNVDYIVEDDQIKLVDMNTGRVMESRSLSDGLHQAIEAKENVTITDENKTQSTITLQNYYRKYQYISGMTGTAKTEEQEFHKLYNMFVIQIPTNKPRIRRDLPDLVYETKKEKYLSIVERVKREHSKGRPILIGTASIQKSIEVAKYLDGYTDIAFEVLNAQTQAYEAKLIAKAGEEGSVMIATNMAGRGTDIILEQKSKELGGLLVICTERHESRRIDNQLIGRAGRQGDPGETQFYISLEDDIFVRHGGERLESFKKKLKKDEIGLILNKDVHKLTQNLQRVTEGISFSIRDYTTKLDDVLNDQRDVVYELRENILEGKKDVLEVAITFTKNHIEKVVEKHCPPDSISEEWEVEELRIKLGALLPGVKIDNLPEEIETPEELFKHVQVFVDLYAKSLRDKNEDQLITQLLKQQFLLSIDRTWTPHLETMLELKNGIFLRSYSQEDPLSAYQLDGYKTFAGMMDTMYATVARNLAAVSSRIEKEGEKAKVVGV